MQLTSEYMDFEEYESKRNSLQPESFENEIWLPVIGQASKYYEVSSLGRFRAIVDIYYTSNSRWAKKGDKCHAAGDIIQQVISEEYITVTLYIPNCLSKDNKYAGAYSHALIAMSFQKHEDVLCTDHINGNKHDNRAWNLQRISYQENVQKSYINNESNRWSNRKSAVICVETNNYYLNLKEACDSTGLTGSNILGAITRGTTAGGYHWKYSDERKQDSIETTIPKRASYHHISNNTNESNWAKCIETDEIQLISDIAKIYHVDTEVIYNAIYFHNGYSKFLDKHFELTEIDESVDSTFMQNYILKSPHYNRHRIRCKESELLFPNKLSASEYYNISVDAISDSIKHSKSVKSRKTKVTYSFERI